MVDRPGLIKPTGCIRKLVCLPSFEKGVIDAFVYQSAAQWSGFFINAIHFFREVTMLYLTDESLEKMIKEDVPYIDLTTLTLEIGQKKGRMRFFTREEAVLCGTEEVVRICNKLNITIIHSLPSGSLVDKGQSFLEVEGNAEALHMAWKISLNILDNCSGIATRTRKLVDKARKVNPAINIYTTRKSFPGTKELAIKGVVVGGGFPHRLGLSETILVFKQHMIFLGGMDGLLPKIPLMKKKAYEKKVLVEAESIEEAYRLCEAGVDGIQLDKLSADVLKKGAEKIRKDFPHVILLAAGGINENNVEEYANTGVDALITTSVYSGKPIDMSVKMEELQ